MGNSQGRHLPSSLVSRPYENALENIKETLPSVTVLAFERPARSLTDGAPLGLQKTFVSNDRYTVKQHVEEDAYTTTSTETTHGQMEDYSGLFTTLGGNHTQIARRLSPKSTPRMRLSKPDDALILPMRRSIPVFGHPSNHKPFLEPQIFPYFFPFIMDESLLACLSTCPHWFVTIYSYLQQLTQPIINGFIARYGSESLELETSTLSVQPLFTAGSSVVRVDLLLYAQVLPRCQNRCTQFGYSFRYHASKKKPSRFQMADDTSRTCAPSDPLASVRLSRDALTYREDSPPLEQQPSVLPPMMSSYTYQAQKSRSYQGLFRFETLRANARRHIWLQRDLCRFHGDELMVASVANVPTVNVGDWLEIPVNLANGFGLVDFSSVSWLPAEIVTGPTRSFGQHCEIDQPKQTWVNLDAFQPTTNERLQVNDYFGPQWKHLKTEFTGIDITCSRSQYVATEIGEVPQSRRWLGIQAVVKPASTPIVCPLTRLGLQHDRFTRQQMRQGDNITLYVSQGGGVLP